MLSKGGKIEYFCPKCGSTDIVQTGAYGKTLTRAGSWDHIPPNHCLCASCDHSVPWSKRGKRSAKK